MKETRPITIFCDIDGTLVNHPGYPEIENLPNETHELKLLPNTLKKLFFVIKKYILFLKKSFFYT